MRPLLSIVIPTKNRYSTLTNLVEKLLDWNSSDYEVVVQDNSEDNTSIKDFLLNYSNDPRFKYFHNLNHVTVCQNSEDAINNSTGEYICFLGDDDGIIKHSLDIVKWMKKNDVDSLNCKQGTYCWPEFRNKNYGKRKSLAGMLIYHSHNGDLYKQDAISGLNSLLENGCLSLNGITRLYHGIVSRDTLNLLKKKTGTYFPGAIADMSSAVGLVFFAKKHYYLNFPLIISGASGASYAGKGAKKNNQTSFEHQPWFAKETIEEWSDKLPKRIVAQTVWPDSAMNTLKKLGHADLISKMNFPIIYAEYLSEFPEFAKEFELFLQSKYSLEEIQSIRTQMNAHRKNIFRSKLRYWVKVYSIYLGINKFLSIERLDANTVGEALYKLELRVENERKTENSYFYQILNS
ncbi:glycosyltransferase family 2 protein [Acinetobacter junii]|uniref:glycosyltransferase family 2 protein n=1 Tax=Acinetobacter junii TaxID=40215 RepID=UPI003AA946E7